MSLLGIQKANSPVKGARWAQLHTARRARGLHTARPARR